MKKFWSGALSVCLVFALALNAFAGGSTPSQQKICQEQKEKTECMPVFGNPYQPNFQYEVQPDNIGSIYYAGPNGTVLVRYKVDASGNRIPVPVCTTPRAVCTDPVTGATGNCACYDPTKPTYEPQGYYECSVLQKKKCK